VREVHQIVDDDRRTFNAATDRRSRAGVSGRSSCPESVWSALASAVGSPLNTTPARSAASSRPRATATATTDDTSTVRAYRAFRRL
jgi:hypothetical protein